MYSFGFFQLHPVAGYSVAVATPCVRCRYLMHLYFQPGNKHKNVHSLVKCCWLKKEKRMQIDPITPHKSPFCIKVYGLIPS